MAPAGTSIDVQSEWEENTTHTHTHRFVDVPAGVSQEEGHTGFLHLPSAVLALIFLARRVQSFLSLVDRECCSVGLLGGGFGKEKSHFSYDFTEIRTHVPTSKGFEVTN